MAPMPSVPSILMSILAVSSVVLAAPYQGPPERKFGDGDSGKYGTPAEGPPHGVMTPGNFPTPTPGAHGPAWGFGGHGIPERGSKREAKFGQFGGSHGPEVVAGGPLGSETTDGFPYGGGPQSGSPSFPTPSPGSSPFPGRPMYHGPMGRAGSEPSETSSASEKRAANAAPPGEGHFGGFGGSASTPGKGFSEAFSGTEHGPPGAQNSPSALSPPWGRYIYGAGHRQAGAPSESNTFGGVPPQATPSPTTGSSDSSASKKRHIEARALEFPKHEKPSIMPSFAGVAFQTGRMPHKPKETGKPRWWMPLRPVSGPGGPIGPVEEK